MNRRDLLGAVRNSWCVVPLLSCSSIEKMQLVSPDIIIALYAINLCVAGQYFYSQLSSGVDFT